VDQRDRSAVAVTDEDRVARRRRQNLAQDEGLLA
jgi:hypothetical protein